MNHKQIECYVKKSHLKTRFYKKLNKIISKGFFKYKSLEVDIKLITDVNNNLEISYMAVRSARQVIFNLESYHKKKESVLIFDFGNLVKGIKKMELNFEKGTASTFVTGFVDGNRLVPMKLESSHRVCSMEHEPVYVFTDNDKIRELKLSCKLKGLEDDVKGFEVVMKEVSKRSSFGIEGTGPIMIPLVPIDVS